MNVIAARGRRAFTAEYKLRIVEWRRIRDAAAREEIPAGKPGRPARDASGAENERLRKETEKLAAELARTKMALEIVAKAHALLEIL